MKLSICLTIVLTALSVAAAPVQPTKTKTSTPLNDLAVGNFIYIIDEVDLVNPGSKSALRKSFTKKNKPVNRLAVVLAKGSSSVQVAYLATFQQSTQLPTSFADKSMWYPILPATKESIYNPLPAPAVDSMAQWACLRRKQTITANPVWKVQDSLSAASANAILNAMKS